jgi:ABC-type multidrug transport system fused ATPase/permease subunit
MFTVSEIIETFWEPLIFARMVQIVTVSGVTDGNIRTLYILTLLFPVRALVMWALHGPARVMEEDNSFRAKNNLKMSLLEGVMGQALRWHNSHHSGDTIDKIEKGTNSLYEFASSSFMFLKPIVKFVGCIGMIVYISHISLMAVLAILILAILITMRFDKHMGPKIREMSKQENQVSEKVVDAITNVTTIIILRVQGLVNATLWHKMNEPVKLFHRINVLNEWMWFLTSICSSLMITSVMAIFIHESKGMSAVVIMGQLTLVYNFAGKISSLFFDFTSLYSWSIRRMYRLLNADELTQSFLPNEPAEHVLPENWKEISVTGLRYNDPASGRPILNSVDLSIHNGETIAFVGMTGSGKTTVLHMLRGLHKPAGAKVYVDNFEIPDGFEGISDAVSLVPQDPEIMKGTVRDNLTMWKDHPQQLVEKFVAMSCFDEVVPNLPRGLDSDVNEKGFNMSGGQKQRLALARGLLAGAQGDIVLMDEPTSSLDMKTEFEVYRRIFRGLKGRTIISSVHRLHLLPLFDRIYVFENGRVVDSGSLQALLQKSENFSKVWTEWQKHKQEEGVTV